MLLFSYFICSNRQAFENIHHMLRHGGTMLVLIVPYHITYDIIEVLMNDIRFSPYMQVNDTTCYIFYVSNIIYNLHTYI
jgi:hypothetical protein